jgi:hypothetical protein
MSGCASRTRRQQVPYLGRILWLSSGSSGSMRRYERGYTGEIGRRRIRDGALEVLRLVGGWVGTEGRYLTHHCPSISPSWIWISENSMLLLRTWVSGACDDLCRVPANSSCRRSPREIRQAPPPSHRGPHPADEPALPLRSAPHTLSGGLEAQSSSPIVLRRAP